MKKSLYSCLMLSLLLFTACGEKQKAKGVINDFLERNMTSGNYNVEDFADIDSTFYVTDSMIHVMHAQAEKNSAFRRDIQYTPRTPKLLFMHVRYTQNGKPVKQTFYMDSALSGVVSFKED